MGAELSTSCWTDAPCALHEPCVRRARDAGDVRWCSLFTKMDPGGEGAIAHGQ
jgi:hypothetical protein